MENGIKLEEFLGFSNCVTDVSEENKTITLTYDMVVNDFNNPEQEKQTTDIFDMLEQFSDEQNKYTFNVEIIEDLDEPKDGESKWDTLDIYLNTDNLTSKEVKNFISALDHCYSHENFELESFLSKLNNNQENKINEWFEFSNSVSDVSPENINLTFDFINSEPLNSGEFILFINEVAEKLKNYPITVVVNEDESIYNPEEVWNIVDVSLDTKNLTEKQIRHFIIQLDGVYNHSAYDSFSFLEKIRNFDNQNINLKVLQSDVELLKEISKALSYNHFDMASQFWTDDTNGVLNTLMAASELYPFNHSFDEEFSEYYMSEENTYKTKELKEAVEECVKVAQFCVDNESNMPTTKSNFDVIYEDIEKKQKVLDGAHAYYKIHGYNIIESENGSLSIGMENGGQITIDKSDIEYRNELFGEYIQWNMKKSGNTFEIEWAIQVNKLLETNYPIYLNNVTSIIPGQSDVWKYFHINFNGGKDEFYLEAERVLKYEKETLFNHLKNKGIFLNDKNYEFMEEMVGFWADLSLSNIKIDGTVIQVMNKIDNGYETLSVPEYTLKLEKEFTMKNIKDLERYLKQCVFEPNTTLNPETIKNSIKKFLDYNKIEMKSDFITGTLEHVSEKESKGKGIVVFLTNPNDGHKKSEMFHSIKEAEKFIKTVNRLACADWKELEKKLKEVSKKVEKKESGFDR